MQFMKATKEKDILAMFTKNMVVDIERIDGTIKSVTLGEGDRAVKFTQDYGFQVIVPAKNVWNAKGTHDGESVDKNFETEEVARAFADSSKNGYVSITEKTVPVNE